MKRIVYIITLIFLPEFLFSSTVGKIKGKICDKETGTPLTGSSVAIIGTTYETVSDTNGNFIILNVPAHTLSGKPYYFNLYPAKILS